MNSTFFLIALTAGVLLTLVYSIVTALPKYQYDKHWKVMLIVISVSALIVGAITGEFTSHGFGIPQWGFSLIFFVFCLGANIVGKVLYLITLKIKNIAKR